MLDWRLTQRVPSSFFCGSFSLTPAVWLQAALPGPQLALSLRTAVTRLPLQLLIYSCAPDALTTLKACNEYLLYIFSYSQRISIHPGLTLLIEHACHVIRHRKRMPSDFSPRIHCPACLTLVTHLTTLYTFNVLGITPTSSKGINHHAKILFANVPFLQLCFRCLSHSEYHPSTFKPLLNSFLRRHRQCP